MRLFGRRRKADEALGAEADLELGRIAVREDLLVFAQAVLRDEATGARVRFAPHHLEWLRALVDEALKRLAVCGYPGSAKTTILSVVVAWLVLRAAAGLRVQPVIYAGPSEKVGRTFLRGVRRLCESDEARDAFPEAERIAWTALSAELPGSGRLPLLVVVGPESRTLSRRGALLIADDIQSGNSARSRDARERTLMWFNETLLTRVLDPSSRVVVSAAAFDSADLISTLARRSDWTTIVTRVLDRTGLPTWPERFPLEAIERIRADSEIVFRRTWLLDPAAGDGRALFAEESLDRAVLAGEGMAYGDAWQGPTAVIAVDPAFTQGGGDASGITVVALEHDGRRRLVDALELREAPTTLAREVVRLARRYRPTVVTIESNGAQGALVSLVRALAPDLRLKAITTTAKSKWGENGRGGLPGLAQSFANGRWCLPSVRQPDGSVVAAPHSKRLRDALRRTVADADVHVDDLSMSALLAHQTIAGSEGVGWVDVNAELGFDPRAR